MLRMSLGRALSHAFWASTSRWGDGAILAVLKLPRQRNAYLLLSNGMLIIFLTKQILFSKELRVGGPSGGPLFLARPLGFPVGSWAALRYLFRKSRTLLENTLADCPCWSHAVEFMWLHPGSMRDRWFPLETSPKQAGQRSLAMPKCWTQRVSVSLSTPQGKRHATSSLAVSMTAFMSTFPGGWCLFFLELLAFFCRLRPPACSEHPAAGLSPKVGSSPGPSDGERAPVVLFLLNSSVPFSAVLLALTRASQLCREFDDFRPLS